MQKQWFDAHPRHFPDTKITLCPGANASAGDVPTMARLPHAWLEGELMSQTRISAQVKFHSALLWTSKMQSGESEQTTTSWDHVSSPEPPIPKAGSPDTAEPPRTWLRSMPSSITATGHYYPPGSSRCAQYWLLGQRVYRRTVDALCSEHATFLTEFHPTFTTAAATSPTSPAGTARAMPTTRCARCCAAARTARRGSGGTLYSITERHTIAGCSPSTATTIRGRPPRRSATCAQSARILVTGATSRPASSTWWRAG